VTIVTSIGLAILLLIAGLDKLNIPSVGGIPGGQSPQLGAFAGYNWEGNPTQVSATWRVPTVKASTTGYAASWIGVQGQAKSEFYQVGTTEQTWDDSIWYEAFWSDEPHHFLAQNMMSVYAGDEIQASITYSDGSWHAQITDLTLGVTRVASPPNTQDFIDINQAEWLQEDPGLPHHQAPYANVAPTHFWQMKVNGAAPDPSQLVAAWMVLPGGVRVVPGTITDDGFTTRRETASKT
jgi:hypothetical protein